MLWHSAELAVSHVLLGMLLLVIIPCDSGNPSLCILKRNGLAASSQCYSPVTSDCLWWHCAMLTTFIDQHHASERTHCPQAYWQVSAFAQYCILKQSRHTTSELNCSLHVMQGSLLAVTVHPSKPDSALGSGPGAAKAALARLGGVDP